MPTDYKPDNCDKCDEKNNKLTEHLRRQWNPLCIEVIRRIETDGKHGWEIEYGQVQSAKPAGSG